MNKLFILSDIKKKLITKKKKPIQEQFTKRKSPRSKIWDSPYQI